LNKIHIEFNHAQGLKIPNSSIIKKECYVFPKEYLSNGPNDDNGTYYLKSVTDNKLVAIDVYYIDDNDMVYIDKDSFEAGTVIRKDNASSKETTLSQTETLNGVYNCNQGYCRFVCRANSTQNALFKGAKQFKAGRLRTRARQSPQGVPGGTFKGFNTAIAAISPL